MKKLILIAVAVLLANPARAADIPAADQRLAAQVATLSLQLARAGEMLEKQKQEIEQLQAQLKPKSDASKEVPGTDKN